MEWILGGLAAVVVLLVGLWAWQRGRTQRVEAEPGLTAAALMEEMSPRRRRAAPSPESEAPTEVLPGDDPDAVLGPRGGSAEDSAGSRGGPGLS